MQRGILKHYVHVLPRIFAERILWNRDDLPALCDWGEGHLTIDIVGGTCLRDRRNLESLTVVRELQAWLADELRKQHDPPDDVTAVLDVTFSATSEAPGWYDVEFDCTTVITSGGKEFVDHFKGSPRVGTLPEQHVDPPPPGSIKLADGTVVESEDDSP